MEGLQLEKTKKAIRQVFIHACITPFEEVFFVPFFPFWGEKKRGALICFAIINGGR